MIRLFPVLAPTGLTPLEDQPVFSSSNVRPAKNLITSLGLFAILTLVSLPQAMAAPQSNVAAPPATPQASEQPKKDQPDMRLVRQAEQRRIATIKKVIGSVIAVYGDERQGGGSGVIIDPSGLALTNHHVVRGAGVRGWGGLADGKLYRWKLIATDPGGDLALIQMQGKKTFPFTPLGDSDAVSVGDWVLAMGNPFILSEDQSPTVTLGIVSGVKRYQPGAGKNQLIYGNCIQVDSSINPGNSGGPLFNLDGQVIGINGRGSFQDRGRVNVGLGYAISSNQIKNFLPELMATKLVEHATLDASFSDRGGKVICSTINQDAPVAQAGLELGDELLVFEGTPIKNANQFTNLICTLPEDWPASLKIRKPNGQVIDLHVRMFGLPYQPPRMPPTPPKQKKLPPEQEQALRKQRELIRLLASPPGTVRHLPTNQKYAQHIVAQWKDGQAAYLSRPLILTDTIEKENKTIGQQQLTLNPDGTFQSVWKTGDTTTRYAFDGTDFHRTVNDQPTETLSLEDARHLLPIVEALGVLAPLTPAPFEPFGKLSIDGSGKASDRLAFRMKRTDEQDEPFFFWLSMADPSQESSPRLLKASPNKDCKNDGGVLFGNWQTIGGLTLPLDRTFVTGLEERETVRLVHQSHTWGKASSDSPQKEKQTSEPSPPNDSSNDPSRVASAHRIFDKADSIITECQPKMVKIFGAGVGRIDDYSTGILVSSEGHILTIQGVYLDGRQVRVLLADGTEHQATILKRDRQTQLALLKIQAETPHHFRLSPEPVGQQGDWVYAITNAFKVADKDEPLSATLGIISLPTWMEARRNRRDVAYLGDLILIDAITSNPGAGGGALVNTEGQLVGMVGKIINSSETNTRLNYAVPTPLLYHFVTGDSVAKNDKKSSKQSSQKADLGIVVFKMGGRNNPAYIDRVKRGSPAAQAGLQADDMIVSIGGHQIGTLKEYQEVKETLVPDEETIIIVKRGIEFLRIPITPRAQKK